MTRGRVLAGVAGAAALLAALALAGPAQAADQARPAAPARQRQIALMTLGDYRLITLTAIRHGRDSQYAGVLLTIYQGRRGHWRFQDQRWVGRTWFWYPLTGRGAVCRLTDSTFPPSPELIEVSLLVTPSIGCSRVQAFRVQRGRLVPVS